MKLPTSIDKLRIVHYPDPVLRVRCQPIATFDEELERLAARMIALMHEARGVGLAAPQVGVSIRLFVCNPTGEPADDHVWVNPVLSDLRDSVEADEGCLSIPGVTVPKRRALNARIEGLDLSGNTKHADGRDLLARIWQHEADHLDGRLVIDDLSPTAELANRRAIQQLEADRRVVR